MAILKNPRIGIIGCGALGSYIGIRLAHAGHSVSFLLRSDYEAVKERGMELFLSDGTRMVLREPSIYRRVEQMGKLDWVIIALKTTRNHLFSRLLPPLVGPDTLLICLQNGLGNVEALEDLFPGHPVLGGLCHIGVNREGPGKVRNFAFKDGLVELAPGKEAGGEDLAACAEVFTSAGIHTRRTASLGEAIWRKLMWNVPFNGLTVAIGGKGTDVVCQNPSLRKVARSLMEEIRLAANQLGYGIEADFTDKLLNSTDKIGAYMASSVLDWLSGRHIEVEALFKNPLIAGTEAGVPMPHLETLTAILQEIGAREKQSGLARA